LKSLYFALKKELTITTGFNLYSNPFKDFSYFLLKKNICLFSIPKYLNNYHIAT
jgi:hypothetical protein